MSHDHDQVDDRFKHLVRLLIDETATDIEVQELEVILQSNLVARQYYRQVFDVHANLQWLYRAEVSNDKSQNDQHLQSLPLDEISLLPPAQADLQSIFDQSTPPGTIPLPLPLGASEGIGGLGNQGAGNPGISGWFTWPQGRIIAFAATILLLITGVIALQFRNRAANISPEISEIAATLQTENNCQWEGNEKKIPVGTKFKLGSKLQLNNGTAKLQFESGAVVVIQSPSVVELSTTNAMRLERGTLAARVNGPIKDFEVRLHRSTIVDRGTSFGVYCDVNNPAEIEVFEGAVEVFPTSSESKKSHVIGFGSAARIGNSDKNDSFNASVASSDRFGNLMEYLGEDTQNSTYTSVVDEGTFVEAEFDDAPTPGTVDTFYGATRGRGWLSPWYAAGNPLIQITKSNPLSNDNQHLEAKFFRSTTRTIARAYEKRQSFDPNEPHLISWKWRFDGTNPKFGNSFNDRVAFYGNPYFRGSSFETNSWLICVNGANETDGQLRRIYPDQWCFFNGKGSRSKDPSGKSFIRKNMTQTGMKFKPGVVYHFAVAVYPKEGKYDAAIRDDVKTVTKSGMNFRSAEKNTSNVVHFSLGTNDENDNSSFSLDSIRIEPFFSGGLEQRVNQAQ